MIRIKDYIFNENDIRSIEKYNDYIRLDLKYKDHYLDIDATFDDIEWNYGNKKRTQEHTITKGVCDKNKKPLLTIEDIQLYIRELEEKNKELVETNYNLATKKTKLEEENKKLKEIESLLENEYENAPHRMTSFEIDLFEIVKRK